MRSGHGYSGCTVAGAQVVNDLADAVNMGRRRPSGSLAHDLGGHFAQLLLVCAGMVSAEDEIAAAGKNDPYLGRCATPVAAVGGRWRCRRRGCGRSHGVPFFVCV
jgi:hypothetical protein